MLYCSNQNLTGGVAKRRTFENQLKTAGLFKNVVSSTKQKSSMNSGFLQMVADIGWIMQCYAATSRLTAGSKWMFADVNRRQTDNSSIWLALGIGHCTQPSIPVPLVSKRSVLGSIPIGARHCFKGRSLSGIACEKAVSGSQIITGSFCVFLSRFLPLLLTHHHL